MNQDYFKLELPHLRPLDEDCLAWSKDGELAIAAGPHVIVLIPNQFNARRNSNNKPWIDVKLKVNVFTDAEWPRQMPKSFPLMDIGEEQSDSHVVQIAWSPPGLALHRRSVLSVLTANNILSLWTSESDPKDPTTWKRVLVLKESAHMDGLPTNPLQVRCMSWCPIDSSMTSGQHTRVESVLAVGLLRGPAVRVYHILSPYRNKSESWSTLELASINQSADQQIENTMVDFQKDTIRNKSPDWLGFSPLVTHDGATMKTVLSCRQGSTLSHHVFSMKKAISGEPFRLNSEGELFWDRPVDNDAQYLVLWQDLTHVPPLLLIVSKHTFYFYRLQTSSADGALKLSPGQSTTMFKDFECGKSTPYNITAVALCVGKPINVLASTQDMEIETFHLKASKCNALKSGVHTICEPQERLASIDQHISSIKHDYIAANKSSSDTLDMWNHGMASHAGIFAICMTLQSRLQATYRTVMETRMTLLFTRTNPDPNQFKFPWQDITEPNMSKAHERIYKKLKPRKNATLPKADFNLRLYYNAAMVALNVVDDQSVFRKTGAEAMLIYLDKAFGERNLFVPEFRLMEQLQGMDPKSQSEKLVNFLQLRLPELSTHNELKVLVDQCPICDEPFTFGMSLDAECLNKHPFGARCGITFLPIKNPKDIKQCSSCYLSFMNERVHPDMKDSDCPARKLLEEFDVCPYCSGKYFTQA